MKKWKIKTGTLLIVILAAMLYRNGVFPIQQVVAPEGFEQAEVVRVVDGDTIDVRQGQEKIRVRFIGIDCEESVAPEQERNTRKGQEEAEFTKSLLPEGTVVYLQKDVEEMDQYERQLRYVWLELPEDSMDKEEVRTKMVNGILIDQGQTKVKRYKPNTMYMDIFWDIYDERD